MRAFAILRTFLCNTCIITYYIVVWQQKRGSKMLNLILNITGSIAIIGNIFLLMVIHIFGKGKVQEQTTKLGFRFLQVLMMLNVLAVGGLLCQKI